MNSKNSSRRKFIKNTATILAGFSIVPRHVLGRGFLAPSDQLTKGIIGVGGMGRGHIPYAGTRVVAICDVDKNHLTEVANSIGGGVKTFHDHLELVNLPEVDIVHIATPPHWHGIMSVDAAKAGKDIWCEKPMTRTIGEGKIVREAMKQYGSSGLLGWPLTVTVSKTTGFDWKFYWIGKTNLEPQPVPEQLDYDRWLGPAPYKPYHVHRTHQTFRGYWDYDGGGLGDMGQHYLDPIQYFLGKDQTSPIKVEVDAEQQHPDACGTFRKITYTYADGCKIILDGEAKDPNAAYIEGPNGKLFAGFKSTIPNLKEKLAMMPDPAPQVTNFLDSVKYRTPFALNEQNGFRSCTLINLGKIALQLGRTLNFDPVKEEFINDTEANYLIHPPMRGPWTI